MATVRRVCCAALDLTTPKIIERDAEDIVLLVGELSANVARHARSLYGYRIEIVLSGDRAEVTVTDTGVGFERAQVPPPGTARAGGDSPADEDRYGGWGLPLIEAVADEVQYAPNEPRGTRVSAVKRFLPE